jgi:hypothetical protein
MKLYIQRAVLLEAFLSIGGHMGDAYRLGTLSDLERRLLMCVKGGIAGNRV